MLRIAGLVEADASHKAPPAGCGAFSRQLEALTALEAWVIPELVERSTADSPARVWVPMCGTGEESYSIAMLMLERFKAVGRVPNVQIFATDAHAESIREARAGLYSDVGLAGISPQRLRNFFSSHGRNQYRVSTLLRECILFAPHDLTLDPPFSRLDLVSSQRALVNREPEVRARIIALLHFALNDDGHLLLDPEQRIDHAASLFGRVSERGCLYRRVGRGRRSLPNTLLAPTGNARAPRARTSLPRPRGAPVNFNEVMSVDDDFQRTNEELETSKEELQSLNEELTTVNGQLQAKVQELDSANRDLINFMTATNISIMFLDAELRIRRFTAPASTPLNLRESDLGRCYEDIATGFDHQLASDARLVIECGTAIEKNIPAARDRCYLRRIQPYRAAGNRIDGVVVTFVDITDQIQGDAQLRRFAAVLRDSEDAILVIDFDGRIRAWNWGAERLYGYTEAEALALNMRTLVPGEVFPGVLDVMRRVAGGEAVPTFDTRRRTRDGRMLDVSATVALLMDAGGRPESLATTERDVTARRRAEDETRTLNSRLEQRVLERTAELQHSEEQIRAILDATGDAVVTIDTLGKIATFNGAAERIFGYTAAEAVGESVTILMAPHGRVGRYNDKTSAWQSYALRFVGTSREVAGRRKDGSVFPVLLSVNAVEGRGLFVGVARDMTDHKALQKEILDVAMLEQRRIGQELHDDTQQELTGLGLLALSLAERLNHDGATAEGQLAARVANGIQQANLRVRSLARGMVPVPIDREGLMSALTDLARQTTELHGLPCGFQCPAPVEIDNDTEATHLYRIAQEAVSNAARHAKASAIWIRLEKVDGGLLLEVRDNGIGLVIPGTRGRGVGLHLMEHRCAMIGGAFSIDMGANGGMCLACSVRRDDHA